MSDLQEKADTMLLAGLNAVEAYVKAIQDGDFTPQDTCVNLPNVAKALAACAEVLALAGASGKIGDYPNDFGDFDDCDED